MRTLLFAVLALGTLGVSTADAQYRGRETGDGCSNSGWCEPGARPGVPRYYSDNGRYGRYNRRHYSRHYYDDDYPRRRGRFYLEFGR